MTPRIDLDGKVAVITGAANGIGLAMAHAFAATGTKLVLADIDGSALHAAADKLQRRGATVLAVPTDVARADDVATLAQRSFAHYGAVHVVCNNAGVGGDAGWSWVRSIEGWQRILEVNLWSVVHGIRTFVPLLLEQDCPAHIVNTASMGGLVSRPFIAPYIAAKFAVVGVSESLDKELRSLNAPIGVSVLCPGAVRTGMARTATPANEQQARDEGERDAPIRAFREAAERSLRSGMEPRDVAAHVIDAIGERRFYVLPHSGSIGEVEQRWTQMKTDAARASFRSIQAAVVPPL